MAPDPWADIDRLFHEALARRPEDRAAFLDEACGEDAALRREVESLLGHEPDAAGFLERPALQQEAEDFARDAELIPADPQIPGFTVLKVLGEGGMGIVYLAEQTVPIRRQVALKLIKLGMDTRQVLVRFDAERQALALMHHPHIAAVYDAGTTIDGRPYFVMEYVEGEPITAYCDRHRMSTQARLELFIDVCGAVQHAHQKGVIHRDLKPSNILVSDSDSKPLPKIIDFGVAKATDSGAVARNTFTEQGMIVGTPEYMSPEQAALSDDIDTTTDVYSLGVLLYELLVGVLPFESSLLRAAGYDEMRRIIRESDPVRPSSRLTAAESAGTAAATARQSDAGRLTRQLRGDLDWITLRALEKDRRQRYPTVSALAADITRFLAHEPITARAPSAAYRMRKFVRRYRGMVAGAAAVALALVAGLIVSISQYARAESERREADLQRNQAELHRVAAETAATDAASQRNAALRATDAANFERVAATGEAAAATVARRDAEYRTYVSSIAAADAELRLNLATEARALLLAAPREYRGWEWQHLLLRTDPSRITLTSNAPCAKPGDDTSFPVTISDHILSVDAARTRLYLRRCDKLEVWEGPSYTRTTHQLPGKILAVDGTGAALITNRTGQTAWALQLVDPATRSVTGRFGPFTAEPICAEFNRDATRLAVGFMPEFSAIGEPLEDYFDVWDVRGQRRLLRLAPPRPPLFDTRRRFPTSCLLAFSPDSTRLASSGSRVHVWRADNGQEVVADPVQAGSVSQPIAWSPDGTRLAIGRLTGLVDLLDVVPTGRATALDGSRFIQVLPLPDGDRRVLVQTRAQNEVLSIAFSRDGQSVVTGRASLIDVWNVAGKRMSIELPGHPAEVIGAGFDAGDRIVSADSSGNVKVWSTAGDVTVGTTVLRGSFSPTSEFVISRDGGTIGDAEMDGGLVAWRLNDLRKIVVRPGSGQLDLRRIARSLAITPNGHDLLAAELDEVGTVRAWALDAGPTTAWKLNQTFIDGCGRLRPTDTLAQVNLMTLTPDGRAIVYGVGQCVVVKDLATQKVVATLRHYPSSFAFRPDGTLLLASYHWVPQLAGAPGHARVMIWDWRHDKVLADVPTAPTRTDFENGSWRASISADGRFIALTGARPKIVSIWDGDLRQELGRLPVPAGTLRAAFSADGRRIATTSADSTVRIWDTERRQLLLILTDDEGHDGGLAFTTDGRLIAGRSSGGLTIWDSVRRAVGLPARR